AAQRAAVGHGLRALGSVENELDVAVCDGVHDVRTPLQHLANLFGRYSLIGKEALGARGRHYLEAEREQQSHRVHDAGLVALADGDEYGALARHAGAAANLTFGERDLEAAIDAHHFAGRSHLRAEHGVDAREAGEGEHRFLHADVTELPLFQIEIRKLLAGHQPRRDFRHRRADHLGDERHGARCARVDLEHVNVAVFDGVLNVHQAYHVEP